MVDKRKQLMTAIIIAVITTYIFYIIAACTDEAGVLSINSIMERLPNRLEKPFFISFSIYTPTFLLYGILLGSYLGVFYYYTRKNRMYGTEAGSARWENVKALSKRLTHLPGKMKPEDAPYVRILSNSLRMNMSDKVTDLNNNILLVAGPGKGKTFRVIKPNVLCCNGSMLITDPKKEILRDTGNYLLEHGYEIKVIDLIDFELSDHYNPFCHIKDKDNIPELIETLWASMEDVKAQKGEPVWDDSAKALIEGFAFYMFMEMEPEKRTFRTLSEMLTELSSSDKGIKNMTKTMQNLREKEPNHPAAIKFLQAMNGAENTVKSVLFSATAKLSKLENEKLLKIFDKDSIDFAAMGTGYEKAVNKPTALFFCIKDGDTRWNFVVSIAIMQAFDELYYAADHDYAKQNGKLPIPVTCWIDEFANVPLPNRFPKLLSTMRGRNISSVITIQDPAQLDSLYEKDAKTIKGDCDVTIYMGGNEIETFEWISKLLGKMTVFKRNTSKSYGANGSESRTDDPQARDLMTPDEVGRLSKKEQIVFVGGEYPIKDKKYLTQNDPRFKEAMRLGPYFHRPVRMDQTPKEDNKETADEKLFTAENGGNKLYMRSITLKEAEELKAKGATFTRVSFTNDHDDDMKNAMERKKDIEDYPEDIRKKWKKFDETSRQIMQKAHKENKMTIEEMMNAIEPGTDAETISYVIEGWSKTK